MRHAIRKISSWCFVALQRSRGSQIAWPVKMFGKWPRVRGAIRLGRHVMMSGETRRSFIQVGPGASFSIGEWSYVNEGLYVICNRSIEIGPNVMIGFSVTDTDAHGVTDRNAPKLGNVIIGAGAWIGANTTILKGVSIGEGAVIGAGSVVIRPIPPHTLAAGNPCRVIRTIDRAEVLGSLGTRDRLKGGNSVCRTIAEHEADIRSRSPDA